MKTSPQGAAPKQTDQWAEKRQIFDSMYRYLVEKIKVAPGWRVAEFGIGKWGFGRFYLEMFDSVIGIDIRDYSSRYPDIEFVLSDGVSIPLKNNSVELVASHSVLEHVKDLDQSLSEINRIVKPGGFVFLTVTPLYFSAYGARLNEGGKHLGNWEHLDRLSAHYVNADPINGPTTGRNSLNKLTSSKFLSAVGRQPWSIVAYDLTFDKKQVPPTVDSTQCTAVDLILRGFRFVGRRER